MPLTFQRPPQSMFHAQRMTKTISQNIPEEQPAPTPEPAELHDFFRFYPLAPEAERATKQHGATPVNPLPTPKPRETTRTMPQQRGNFSHQPQRPQQLPPLQMMPPQQPPQLPPMQMIPPQHTQRPQMAPMQPQQQPSQPQITISPQPPSPEKAAQHFRSINKSLPDGVMYEPIDDDIVRLLKDNGHLPKSQPQSAPVSQHAQQTLQSPPQPIPPPPQITSPEIAKTIENLAQNERNAQIFYSSISSGISSDETKKSLSLLAEGCKARTSQYIQILQVHFNSQFTPQEKELNTNLPFNDAISLAISEENKALSTLSNLLDRAEGTPFERQLERIISKKVVSHQILLSVHTTTIPAPRSLRYPPLSPEASL